MTSPSLRKHPITRPSTRRWNLRSLCRRLASYACFSLIALAIIAGPGSPAHAGKKRRDASLDQLKERNPTERWKTLQKLWRTDDETTVSQPAQVVTPPPVTAAATSKPAVSAVDRSSQAPSAIATPVRLPALSAETSDADQMWEMDQTVQAEISDSKRIEAGPVDVSYRQNVEKDAMSMDETESARLRPITSIMPYYDYSPNGEDPCDFLCPQPGGCPENKLKKPCPELVDLPDVPFEERLFADTHVTWEASNLFSNPLYFEDAGLERYGHTHCDLIQPFVSVGKFGVQLVGLPYQMALHPICERRYALGWYRPGECAPYKYYLPPWNTKAAITAGAVYTGLFYLIP